MSAHAPTFAVTPDAAAAIDFYADYDAEAHFPAGTPAHVGGGNCPVCH